MSGPLTGYRIIEIAGIGPGPFAAMLLADMGADVIRVDRAQAVRGPAPDDAGHATCSLRGRRNVAIDLKHPDGVGHAARPRRAGRRADRGLPPRRDGAPRPRPRRVPRPQPEAGLRAHDRLGPGRPVRRRRPATTSTTSRSPARWPTSAGPARRRCRRSTWSATSAAAACSSPSASCARCSRRSAAAQGQVVDAAMVDGAAMLMTMFWSMSQTGVCDESAPRHQPARHRRPLLRRLRVRRRRVHLDRLDRAAVLRRAAAPHRPRRRRPGVRQADGHVPRGRR